MRECLLEGSVRAILTARLACGGRGQEHTAPRRAEGAADSGPHGSVHGAAQDNDMAWIDRVGCGAAPAPIIPYLTFAGELCS